MRLCLSAFCCCGFLHRRFSGCFGEAAAKGPGGGRLDGEAEGPGGGRLDGEADGPGGCRLDWEPNGGSASFGLAGLSGRFRTYIKPDGIFIIIVCMATNIFKYSAAIATLESVT